MLPVGIDLERFRPIPRAEARARLGLDPDGPYLLFPHDPRGRSSATTARARRPATRRLLTLGDVDPDEVPYWINAANAVLVPSQDEGFGLAVIEALACDVPALGTPGRHPPRRARGIAGALCAPSGTREPGGRRSRRTSPTRTRASTARARAELFSADRMAARVVAAWRALSTNAAYRRAPILGSDRRRRAFRHAMSGLLRRIRRPRRRRGDPDGAPSRSPARPTDRPRSSPPPSAAGQRLPAGHRRPRTSSAAARPAAAAGCAAACATCAASASSLLRDLGGLVFEIHRRSTPTAGAARRRQARRGSPRSTPSCASSRRALGDRRGDDRAARARHRRHLPALRRAARAATPASARAAACDRRGRDPRPAEAPRRGATASAPPAERRRAATPRHRLRGGPHRERPRRRPTAGHRRRSRPPGADARDRPPRRAPRPPPPSALPALRRAARARPGVVPELRHRRRRRGSLRTPGWRTPVAIVGALLALLAAALVLALVELSRRPAAGRARPRRPPRPPPARPRRRAAPAPTPPARPRRPADARARAATAPDRRPAPPGTADADRRRLADVARRQDAPAPSCSPRAPPRPRRRAKARDRRAAADVGVLDSDDFSSLRNGYWVVFAGQYDRASRPRRRRRRGARPARRGAYARRVDADAERRPPRRQPRARRSARAGAPAPRRLARASTRRPAPASAPPPSRQRLERVAALEHEPERRADARRTPAAATRSSPRSPPRSPGRPPAGRRAWASKPADTSTSSRLLGRDQRQRRRARPASTKSSSPDAGRHRQVDRVALARARAEVARRARCPDTAATGGSRRTGRSGRAWKISLVPLPWWTSQSRISTRSRPWARVRVPRGDGDVAEEAEAHRPRRLGVVAGRPQRGEAGRAPTRRAARRPARRRRPPRAAPPPRSPAPRRCPCRSCRRRARTAPRCKSTCAAGWTASSCSRVAAARARTSQPNQSWRSIARLERDDPLGALGMAAGCRARATSGVAQPDGPGHADTVRAIPWTGPTSSSSAPAPPGSTPR